ncbi:MAG: hypothetical protein ACR2QT_12750 [Woeseiaceae bacterium]
MARLLLIFLFTCVPAAVLAGLGDGDLPAARWYAHVDLVEMRSGDAGKQLYDWLDDEVFEELREEVGFDASKEADTITALATPEGGIMVVVDGKFTQSTQDKIVAIGAAGSDFNALEYGDTVYYFIGDDDDPGEVVHDNDSLDDGAYLSLALNNKLIVTSTEEQMHKLIDSNGKIPGDYDNGDSLIVLSAERSLVQAGMSADGIGEDLGWDSNMLRNTKQVALVVADAAGKIAIEAQLIAAEEEVASSLASIVRGLISLQIFNEDMDPEIAEFLQNTKVDVSGATLTVKVAIDADVLVDAID